MLHPPHTHTPPCVLTVRCVSVHHSDEGLLALCSTGSSSFVSCVLCPPPTAAQLSFLGDRGLVGGISEDLVAPRVGVGALPCAGGDTSSSVRVRGTALQLFLLGAKLPGDFLGVWVISGSLSNVGGALGGTVLGSVESC